MTDSDQLPRSRPHPHRIGRVVVVAVVVLFWLLFSFPQFSLVLDRESAPADLLAAALLALALWAAWKVPSPILVSCLL